ncbi:MAG TPA: VCBS repeat-containing protein, partial [Longimicrobiales bacterium]
AGNNPWFVPSPFTSGPLQLAQEVQIAAARCPTIASTTTTTFPVRGRMSGIALGTYTNTAANLVHAPAGRGGNFFPGEQIESTLTTALGGTRPMVARWRVAAAGGTATFERVGTGVALPRPAGQVGLFDMDNDGDLDVALGGLSGSTDILFFRNPGNGALPDPISVPVGNYADAFINSDLDSDGDVDLAVSINVDDQLVILLNNPTGTFTVTQRANIDHEPKGIEAADIDGDGDLDLMTTSSDQLGRIFHNNGNATFVAGPSIAAGPRPLNVLAFDIDADFDLDLVYADGNSTRLFIFKNNGFGQFSPPPLQGEFDAGGPTQFAAWADFDGDGDFDMALCGGNGRVTLMRNDGSGVFTAVDLPTTKGGAAGLVATDFDGDGDFDIATARSVNAGVVQLLTNLGDGTFTQTLIPTGFANPSGVFGGDIDNDGDIDLVVSHEAGNRVVVLINQ